MLGTVGRGLQGMRGSLRAAETCVEAAEAGGLYPCEGRLNPSRLEDYAAPHRACHASESLTNEHVIA